VNVTGLDSAQFCYDFGFLVERSFRNTLRVAFFTCISLFLVPGTIAQSFHNKHECHFDTVALAVGAKSNENIAV